MSCENSPKKTINVIINSNPNHILNDIPICSRSLSFNLMVYIDISSNILKHQNFLVMDNFYSVFIYIPNSSFVV